METGIVQLKHTYHVLQRNERTFVFRDVHANSPAINLMKTYSSGER